MKTAEEKAREYADETYPTTDSNDYSRTTAEEWDACYDGYMAGYAEAMRWRDPKEELPEFNKKDYLNGDYKKYLIMVVIGNISKRRSVTVGWLISANRWSVEMGWVNVIGWRPIE